MWVDELSSFGTFPIESMKCGTPIVGKIPRMVPEWMGTVDENGNLNLNDNGIWTANLNAIPDIIATIVGLYLEDVIPTNLLESMEEYKSKYTQEEMKQSLKEVYNRIFGRRIVELKTIGEKEEEKLNNTPELQIEK